MNDIRDIEPRNQSLTRSFPIILPFPPIEKTIFDTRSIVLASINFPTRWKYQNLFSFISLGSLTFSQLLYHLPRERGREEARSRFRTRHYKVEGSRERELRDVYTWNRREEMGPPPLPRIARATKRGSVAMVDRRVATRRQQQQQQRHTAPGRT